MARSKNSDEKITSCAKSVELENLGRVLYKTKCKWENELGK
jgi:hypothetical protein